MSKPRTEPLSSYPEDANTPSPVSHAQPDAQRDAQSAHAPDAQAHNVAAARHDVHAGVHTSAAPPHERDPFEFKDGKAYACDEGGKMVRVKLEAAQAAASHIGNTDPAIRKRAAASCAVQFPFPVPEGNP